jgi:hypothetical protein
VGVSARPRPPRVATPRIAAAAACARRGARRGAPIWGRSRACARRAVRRRAAATASQPATRAGASGPHPSPQRNWRPARAGAHLVGAHGHGHPARRDRGPAGGAGQGAAQAGAHRDRHWAGGARGLAAEGSRGAGGADRAPDGARGAGKRLLAAHRYRGRVAGAPICGGAARNAAGRVARCRPRSPPRPRPPRPRLPTPPHPARADSCAQTDDKSAVYSGAWLLTAPPWPRRRRRRSRRRPPRARPSARG